MDKVILKSKDIEDLLSWRDQHKEEVRNSPAPLKSVEIVCPESGCSIKGIRDGHALRLYLNRGGQSMGHAEFRHRIDGMWIPEKNRMKATADELQSVLTVYCSLMALMVAAPVIQRSEENVKRRDPSKPHHSSKKRGKKRTTYIIRKAAGTILAAPTGSHASPRGIFTVRGHWRHYKSGKVVWVSEYKKGTGGRKSKTYKMGGTQNV